MLIFINFWNDISIFYLVYLLKYDPKDSVSYPLN